MGTRERQEREREIVRRAIVDAARELFVAEGFAKVSMRKIAERIEYSPAAIYSYFPGKDDIFYALAEEGFRLLCDGLPQEQETDALNIVRRGLHGLYRFSQAHPEYYALMFLDRAVPTLKGAADRIPKFASMVDRMHSAMRRCIDEGVFPGATDPIAVFDVLKTAVHGAATATVCGRLRPGVQGEALAHDLIEITIAGLRSGVPLTFVPSGSFAECPATASAVAGTEPEPVESSPS
jgi:AcrR family transcriptional regulator